MVDALRQLAGPLLTWSLVGMGIAGFALVGTASNPAAPVANIGMALVLVAIAGGIGRFRHVRKTRKRPAEDRLVQVSEDLNTLHAEVADLNRRVSEIENERLGPLNEHLSALQERLDDDAQVIQMHKRREPGQ